MEPAATAISPDGRGRVLLTRLVDELEDHYLGSVSSTGVITLVPAILQPKMMDNALDMAPDLLDELEEQVSEGTQGAESELWNKIRPETAE